MHPVNESSTLSLSTTESRSKETRRYPVKVEKVSASLIGSAKENVGKNFSFFSRTLICVLVMGYATFC